MCLGSVFVYPQPDWMKFSFTDFSQSAVDQWLDDAYELGLWDVDVGGLSLDDLMQSAESNISSSSYCIDILIIFTRLSGLTMVAIGTRTTRTPPLSSINSGMTPLVQWAPSYVLQQLAGIQYY